jgi:hydrogenase maturation protease
MEVGRAKAKLAVIGVGNTLAGDDGAGIHAVRRVREAWGGDPEVFFHFLEGDLYEIGDLLDRAPRIIIVDALAGEVPGVVVAGAPAKRAFAPSFHQADIGAVMRQLERIGGPEPFPAWEIWGVTIRPPRELGEGLSPDVEAGVVELSARLSGHISDTLGRPAP